MDLTTPCTACMIPKHEININEYCVVMPAILPYVICPIILSTLSSGSEKDLMAFDRPLSTHARPTSSTGQMPCPGGTVAASAVQCQCRLRLTTRVFCHL